MERRPMNAPELARFIALMDAYEDKELQPMYGDDDEPQGGGEPQYAVLVAYRFGDRVRLLDDPEGVVGRVVVIEATPGGVRYEISWAAERAFSQHWAFELEAAD